MAMFEAKRLIPTNIYDEIQKLEQDSPKGIIKELEKEYIDLSTTHLHLRNKIYT